ncbi:MAG: hypothetical protein K2X60_10720, partial [Xanthobacteraceae bacterium]|nr:hypothetical protein [Xanthobacteraceae bacterium]
ASSAPVGTSGVMNLVRSKARTLSLLALFTLAVQFSLSFGHVHGGTFAPLSAQTSFANTSLPSTDRDPDGGNDVCAICVTIAMANTLVDAAPPILPLPAQIHTAPVVISALLDTAQPQRLSFQSRAPPRS